MNLPPAILGKIFAFVCPQSTDESYETCEQSALEDTCMLCDLRDLAHCTAVCKTWRASALNLLYHSIRLDTVHYCDREAYLSDMRKRGSFLNRNADPEDATQARLKLLCRTLREDPTRLGTRVEFFKTPYMLREANQADLARTIAVLPNLKYVDLPEGMYMDDPSCVTLRLEVQARCREIRKMTYMGGAERSLQELAYGTVFTKLEVLELIKINIDPSILRQVLHGLRNIRALKVTETKNFTDEMFYWNDMMVPVPALEELVLNEVPNVTAEGLSQWLMSSPDASNTLKVLSLKHTGVEPWTLYQISTLAPALKNLSITRSVSSALSTAIGGQQAPLLTSKSLEVLHYEIFSTVSVTAASTTASYYNHLASSLLSGGLPNLRAVYVRDPNFPDTLLGLPPPMPGFADGAFVGHPQVDRMHRSDLTPLMVTDTCNHRAYSVLRNQDSRLSHLRPLSLLRRSSTAHTAVLLTTEARRTTGSLLVIRVTNVRCRVPACSYRYLKSIPAASAATTPLQPWSASRSRV